MKKLTVFLTAFILVTVSAAADINIGGSFDITANMARGDTWSDSEPKTSLIRDLNIYLLADTDDGRFGAKGALVRNTNFWVYAWWMPVDFFMIKMGAAFEDSTWSTTDLDAEGLHGNKFSNLWTAEAFPGNIMGDATGFFTPVMTDPQMERVLQLSFYPLKGLAVNLGFPMDRSAFDNIAEYNYVYKMHAQAVYAIDGIGEAAVSFINAPDEPDEFQNVFAQWKMPVGDSLKLELGINMGFNSEFTAPLNIGLGLGFNGGQFALNARAAASVPMEDTQDTKIGADIVANYDFELLKLYVPVGIGVTLPADEGGTSLYWSFAPYVTKKLGGPFFYTGFKIYQDAVADGMNWSIPLGFRWDF